MIWKFHHLEILPYPFACLDFSPAKVFVGEGKFSQITFFWRVNLTWLSTIGLFWNTVGGRRVRFRSVLFHKCGYMLVGSESFQKNVYITDNFVSTKRNPKNDTLCKCIYFSTSKTFIRKLCFFAFCCHFLALWICKLKCV